MAMATTSPIVSIQNVSKLFGGSGAAGGQTHALARVSLDIAPGEFVSLLGPSGCGKSTLLRLVADLIEPSDGQITVKGKTPRQARLDREYGIVFQSPVLYDWRNVLHNVELPLEVMRFPAAERDRRGRGKLPVVGAQEVDPGHPRELSGGMQPRGSIARAPSVQAALRLMGEPV